MGAGKPFSLEERKEIEELISKGCPYNGIGRLLSRSKSSIIAEVKTNGGKDKYQAMAAHKWNLSKQERRLASLKKTCRKKYPIVSLATLNKKRARLEERINLLEDKMKIVMEKLKNDYSKD